MYSRKDKSDSGRSTQAQTEGVLELFSMLESLDPQSVESVKTLIQENLSGAKDSRLLYGLVDYYMAVQSKRSLDILVRVREPHDKHLFDKLVENLKNERTRYRALQLLCDLIYRQPSWLHKIVDHRIMRTLINLLKTDQDVPNLMCALFTIICLLPMIPSQFGTFLGDTFDIFSRLASWIINKPVAMPEICSLHLHIGVYSLFHRLYGMYPCNFLAYLRSYYGGRDHCENLQVFSAVIKPMLERVRLHPFLVIASKETELNANRWKTMATHDIVAECANISLDATEGSFAGIRGQSHTFSSISSSQTNVFSHDSLQQVSFSSQSSTLSITVEPGSLVSEAANNNQEMIWSPSYTCGFSTPPPSVSSPTTLLVSKSDSGARIFTTQLSSDEKVPLDIAIEAKPELSGSERNSTGTTSKFHTRHPSKDSKSEGEADTSLEDSGKIESSSELQESVVKSQRSKIEVSKQSSLGLSSCVTNAVEAKEEDIDKEVSELTSCPNECKKTPQRDVRHNTPFCHTTQNLTDEPTNLECDPTADPDRSDSLTKSIDEDVADEMYGTLPDVENIVKTLNRYRYISLCETQQPAIAVETVRRKKSQRSRSCPEIETIAFMNSKVDPGIDSKVQSEAVGACSSAVAASCAFVPLQNSVDSGIASNIRDSSSYEQLIPMAMDPLPCPREMFGLGNEQVVADSQLAAEHRIHFYSRLSPPELLDRYLQMGNDAYVNQLNMFPIPSSKNTDWTHFGGPPPADEVAILRNQILLLHDQLLFERHRKEIHSERNRRILGRAKTSRMQEEQILALKYQVGILQKEKEQWQSEHLQSASFCNQLRAEKNLCENELHSIICKKKQENDSLLFSNKKLQGLLVSQKQENDEIVAECKRCQAELLNLRLELELSNRELARCQKLEKENIYMSKQLILLQELNSHYKDKIDLLKEPSLPDIGVDLMKEAVGSEIKDLKLKLEVKSCHLDASKSKITELEGLLSAMKLKLKEQSQVIEYMKSLHQSEIVVREDRIADLKKAAINMECHMLELYHQIHSLTDQIRVMQKRLKKSNSANFAESSENDVNFQHGNVDEARNAVASNQF